MTEEKDEEPRLYWKLLMGAFGPVLVVTCTHCQKLVDEIIKDTTAEPLH